VPWPFGMAENSGIGVAMSEMGRQVFGRMIVEMGGEVLPGFNDARCADFLFRHKNMIVEMKILDEQARNEHAARMEALVNAWVQRGLLEVDGKAQIEVPKLSPVCQQEWFEVLNSSAENLVRDANRQIRATKQRLALQNAKSVFLVGNEGNLLHASPEDYLTLVAGMLAKWKQAAQPRFFHVQAAVYFSLKSPTGPQGLPFWAAGQVDREDEEMRAFLGELRYGCFAAIGKVQVHDAHDSSECHEVQP